MPLAPQVTNPGRSGQNARYHVRGLPRDSNGRLTDGTWHYDDNGLSLDRPDSVVSGLRAADELNGMDPQDLPFATANPVARVGSLANRTARPTARPRPALSQTAGMSRAQQNVMPYYTSAATALTEALLGRAERTVGQINARSSAIGSALSKLNGGPAAFGQAAANQQMLGDALRTAIGGTGRAIGADLAAKFAGIQAPGATSSVFAGGQEQEGQQAAQAMGALSSAEVEQLKGQQGAASAYMGALPRLAQLVGESQRRGVVSEAAATLADKLGELYADMPKSVLDE